MGLFKIVRRDDQPQRFGRFRKPRRLHTQGAIGARQYLYEQTDFRQLLHLERRRSERSNRPLCLVLLGGIRIADGLVRKNALLRTFQVLRSTVRETDIIGWYQQNSVLAVLFPDLNAIGNDVVESLHSKVTKAIESGLAPDLTSCLDISVHVFPKRDEKPGMDNSKSYPELPSHSQVGAVARVLKRGIDIISSGLLLLLLAPVLVCIALMIKLTSHGPILFKQLRVGQQGRPFTFWKFRSMYAGSDAAIHKEYVTNFISGSNSASPAKAVYKIINDPRVTPVGRFLRKTSLDELPQLWNVFRGEMSLVGPRPALPYELECYAAWHRRRVNDVKPGITGLWQVNGRSRTSFNDMVRLDLRYVQQWSIWLDFKILLQTPKAVLLGEGAY